MQQEHRSSKSPSYVSSSPICLSNSNTSSPKSKSQNPIKPIYIPKQTRNSMSSLPVLCILTSAQHHWHNMSLALVLSFKFTHQSSNQQLFPNQKRQNTFQPIRTYPQKTRKTISSFITSSAHPLLTPYSCKNKSRFSTSIMQCNFYLLHLIPFKHPIETCNKNWTPTTGLVHFYV